MITGCCFKDIDDSRIDNRVYKCPHLWLVDLMTTLASRVWKYPVSIGKFLWFVVLEQWVVSNKLNGKKSIIYSE